MLKRKIEDILLEWKRKEDKKPLIVKGARQVGKTESIRLFGKKNYKSVVEINILGKGKQEIPSDENRRWSKKQGIHRCRGVATECEDSKFLLLFGQS